MKARIAALLTTTLLASNAFAIDWNARAVRACGVGRTVPGECQGHIALVRDAMTAASQAYGRNGGNGNGHGESLVDAARAVAAYVVLERLYPDAQEGLEMELAASLASFPESQAKADALAAGRRAAESLLARR